MNKIMTLEPWAYLSGVFQEFEGQRKHNFELIRGLMTLRGKVELSEKNLSTTRDHLAMLIDKAEVPIPKEWKQALASVRFVGWRLADACVVLLQEKRELTFEPLLDLLNSGNYRFRTTSPLREIHAAVLRHPHIQREGNLWKWTGPEKGQKQLQLLKAPAAEPGKK